MNSKRTGSPSRRLARGTAPSPDEATGRSHSVSSAPPPSPRRQQRAADPSRARLRRFTLVTAAAWCVLVLGAIPSEAIIGGTDDTTNRFPNVGVLQLQWDGEWFSFCSGTLVAADVVLTSAHCTDFFDAEEEDSLSLAELRVSFDAIPHEGSLYYSVDRIVIHPDWFSAPLCTRNSKMLCLAPPREDIALVFLDQSVAGVAPAPIADPGYVDALTRRETLTIVGYGFDEFITGSVMSPKAVVRHDADRTYRDVSMVPGQDLVPDRFLKLTGGACFGDSGGPAFHDGSVVGVTTWRSSARCDGPSLSYRVDSPAARSFLEDHL